MFIEKAIFVNRAPFEHLELDFKEKGINVLTAINGRGKTTILSHIVDAFYELARYHFKINFEGKENKYYRVSTVLYNVDVLKPSFVYLRFKHDGQFFDYIDVRNNCSKKEYDDIILLQDKIKFNEFSETLNQKNCIKYWTKSIKVNVEDIFYHNILTYFPSYRYEEPGYLNDPYSVKLDFTKESGFRGYHRNQIEAVSGINSLVNWFLDVLLDMKINEKTRIANFNGNLVPYNIPTKEQTFVWDNLNKILSKALYSKHYKGVVRLGIGQRQSGSSRVVVMNDEEDGTAKLICPSIFNLSSGELSLFSLFGEILHQADNNKNNIQLNEIYGIVLIDEIEKHLHISLQKEILPELFKIFPNIQFIISSHSPFLNMGLAEICPDDNKIFDLENNGVSCSATTNELYKEVYDLMVNENNRFAEKYENLKNEINSITKPIVITEGKTDIKHILKAKEKLNIRDIEFDIIDEENQPQGDSSLKKLLEQFSFIQNKNKIIGIFDRDCDSIVKVMEENGQQYKEYGNNVYAFCIGIPQSRIENGQKEISIEYLYSDNEIKTNLENGCRLFFGDEFSEKTGKHKIEPGLIIHNQSERGKSKIVENNGDQAVYDEYEHNVLAKKDDFAEAISKEKITISKESWNNFMPIFDKIREIISK